MAARCTSIAIDRNARKGKEPSDHAPVIAEFA
jgi:exonuclease III